MMNRYTRSWRSKTRNPWKMRNGELIKVVRNELIKRKMKTYDRQIYQELVKEEGTGSSRGRCPCS